MVESSQIRVAIRAPEYFPRLEYFALMRAVDVFVIADTFQYSRQSFQNRTQIRTPAGRLWLSIPLLGGQHGRRICDVQVAQESDRWQRKHWRSLEFNYRSAPYFEYFEAELADVLRPKETALAEYTISSILCIRDILELRAKVVLASELRAGPSTVSEIMRVVDGHELITLEDTFELDRRAVTRVRVVTPGIEAYRQNFDGFEVGLSALDAVFNIGPFETTKLIGVE
ncbi:MAG: WbqC family protein [Rhodothermia bacterium]|nr:WbqC family protein [Rhodothermia bacterium]